MPKFKKYPKILLNAEEVDTEEMHIWGNEDKSGSEDVHVESNHIFFYSPVTDASIKELGVQLKSVERENLLYSADLELPTHRPIHLHINSGGGSYFAGMAGAELIRKCRVPVHTHIEGCVASAATFLSLMGTHRTIGKWSYVLIHQLSSGFFGTYENLTDEKSNMDLLMKQMKKLYEERTTIKKKVLDDFLKHDLWWTADIAKTYGIVDEII